MKRKYSQEAINENMSGRIYVNADDLNIFVKRKDGCSWTMNLGNKWSWVIMGIAILLTVALVAFIVR